MPIWIKDTRTGKRIPIYIDDDGNPVYVTNNPNDAMDTVEAVTFKRFSDYPRCQKAYDPHNARHNYRWYIVTEEDEV